MIDHIEILSEGFELKDKSIQLLRPEGYERYEGREATVIGKYAHDEVYYVKLKSSGKIFVVKKGEFIIL